jgi:hypothetical protein
MFDGAEPDQAILGNAIVANAGDIEAALIAYERESFPPGAAEAMG